MMQTSSETIAAKGPLRIGSALSTARRNKKRREGR